MNHDLVRCSDIAKMADVSPTTVSTWIKRYVSFPPVVRTYGTINLYSRQSVVIWLDMNRPLKNKPSRNVMVNAMIDQPTTKENPMSDNIPTRHKNARKDLGHTQHLAVKIHPDLFNFVHDQAAKNYQSAAEYIRALIVADKRANEEGN